MRTIIAGSSNFNFYDDLLRALYCIGWKPTVVLSGGARGVNRLGERWARENNISLEVYPADWDRYGKRAGYIRNSEMIDKAEALLALWDWESLGTKHIIDLATKKSLVMYVYKIPKINS